MLLIAACCPVLTICGQMPDAVSIAEKSRDLSLTGSMQATINMVITEKNGGERRRKIILSSISLPGGTEKRMIRFIEPADVKGTSILIFDKKNESDEMWIYLPALKRTRRIVASEGGRSFMSSEFTNSDMSSPVLSDFSYRHLGGSGSGDRWIIESVPSDPDKLENYGFSRKVSFIGMKDYCVRKMEFYNREGELFKIMEIKDFRIITGGNYMITEMTSRNLSNGRSSSMKFSEVQIPFKVEESYFSIQNLER